MHLARVFFLSVRPKCAGRILLGVEMGDITMDSLSNEDQMDEDEVKQELLGASRVPPQISSRRASLSEHLRPSSLTSATQITQSHSTQFTPPTCTRRLAQSRRCSSCAPILCTRARPCSSAYLTVPIRRAEDFNGE